MNEIISEQEQIESVTDCGMNIWMYDNPSEEMQLAAVQDWVAIGEIKNPTEKVKELAAKNIDFNSLLEMFCLEGILDFQQKIKDYITEEQYRTAPKNFPWMQEIRDKFTKYPS